MLSQHKQLTGPFSNTHYKSALTAPSANQFGAARGCQWQAADPLPDAESALALHLVLVFQDQHWAFCLPLPGLQKMTLLCARQAAAAVAGLV